MKTESPMNELVRQRLVQLVKQQGKTVAEDARRCRNLLNDALRNEYRKEVNVLVHAIEAQVVCDLLNSSSIPPLVLIDRSVKKLRDDKGTGEAEARWAVGTWALAFGLITDRNNSPPNPTPPTRSIAIIVGGCLIVLALVAIGRLVLSPTLPAPNTVAKNGEASPLVSNRIPNQPPPKKIESSFIMPADAKSWEDKEATVRFQIGSTSDKLEWAFMINSQKQFTDPLNFQIAVEKASAGNLYKEMGITSLTDHFKANTTIRVTGIIKFYKGRYQIKVNDPSQIVRE